MGDINEKYGDLTDKELFEFLDEIENNDKDIQEAQSEAINKIELEEKYVELSEEEPENKEIEAYYGDNAWYNFTLYGTNGVYLNSPENKRKFNMASIKSNKQRLKNLREDRLRIQREAFSQENINLSDPIGNDKIKLLISLLVNEHTRMINKYSAFINKRLATLLNPFIPRRLRMCKNLYPNSIRICPGFLYKASKEYGAELTFWATPDIPYYFTQNTEQEMLIKHKPQFLISVDQAIKFYHEHLKKRANKEIKYASLICQKGINSYFDLLKLNPFWYETLYNEIIKD